MPTSVPAIFVDQLNAELKPDEAVLWAEQSDRYTHVERRATGQWTLRCAAAGVAGIAAVVVGSSAVFRMNMAGAIIIGIGIVLVFAAIFVFAIMQMARTWMPDMLYVLTNKRALFLCSHANGTPVFACSIQPQHLSPRIVENKSDGTSTITFPGAPFPTGSPVRGFKPNSKKHRVGMYSIKGADEVDRLIRETFGCE